MYRGTENAYRTAVLFLTALVLCVVCGCSNYFTPWTGFQPGEYDLGPGVFVPAATPLAVPDSAASDVSRQSAAWYSFPASKDSTYAIEFYPRYSNAVIDIFDSSSQSVIQSAVDTSVTLPVSVFWICKRTATYYLRIRQDSTLYYSSTPGPGPFAVSVKSFADAYGSAVDVYEPDNTQALAAPISFTTGNTAEVFQIHRIAPGDTDWYVFSPNYSYEYVIRTVGNVDTKICMLSQTGNLVVASDDSSGGGQNARLTWICPYSSGSYIRNFFVTGTTTGVYAISVSEKLY
jgi:hypothetical protein